VRRLTLATITSQNNVNYYDLSLLGDKNDYIYHLEVTSMKDVKQKIINSAITLLKQNINCSLEDISENANISKRTLHRHFNGKEDLIIQVFQKVGSEYMEGFSNIMLTEKSAIDKLEMLLKYDLKMALIYRMIFNLYESFNSKYKFDQKVITKVYEEFYLLFVKIVDEGHCKQSLNAEWLGYYYTNLIDLGIKQINLGVERDECIQIILELFWNGVSEKK